MAQTWLPGMTVAEVARRYEVNTSLVFSWRRDPKLRVEESLEPPPIPAALIGAPWRPIEGYLRVLPSGTQPDVGRPFGWVSPWGGGTSDCDFHSADPNDCFITNRRAVHVVCPVVG